MVGGSLLTLSQGVGGNGWGWQRTVRKQQGEFRLVLSDGGRHALITSVTVQGLDYYVVERFTGGKVLRQRLHRLGQSHTYVFARRPIPATQGKPMDEFAGIRSVWGSSLNGVAALRDWTYKPSADRPNRRINLVVPTEALLPLTSVDVWLVQSGRPRTQGRVRATL